MGQLKFLLLSGMVAFSSLAVADRNDKVQQIMQAQGLLQTFEQQIEMGRAYNQEQAQTMLNQMMQGLQPTPDFTQRFEHAFQTFLDETQTPWGAAEVVAVWSEHYGQHFTDAELDQLLTHYRSPLAQKEVAASRKALVSFSNHFADAGKPVLENATAHFIARLKQIAQECNCQR